ncbi:sensor histidine kinase [Streptomyces sp. N35]|uniref:sensor histidine kinase n=1 Tax=Streptomyces sp. N35 TaxID=2795730 RepID=UPI0018F51E99|nr:histidine kinase [Streptomyces sp. N35]
MMWIGIWLVFLASPIQDLAGGHHTTAATVLGWLGLGVFVAAYLSLVFRFTSRIGDWLVPGLSLLFLYGLGSALAYSLGDNWLGLFIYVSVAMGAVLPFRHARWAIPVVTATMIVIGMRTEPIGEVVASLGLLTLMIGFAMCGIRQLVRTTIQLREARATVAELAANEERLRLARDLHDLLGHSLSLITLKSELAGRMLPAHPEQAAGQIADIERVSRQALVDVREAVTGYRRATLSGELAGARTVLAAAGIAATVPAQAPALPEAAEEALAWALREAVTNVVRHSGARRCTVDLVGRQTLDGPVFELVVEDDGPGGAAGQGEGLGAGRPGAVTGGRGNGLTGLEERLSAAGGTLGGGPRRKGFRPGARVPLGAAAPRSVRPGADVPPGADGSPGSDVPPGSGAPLGSDA